MNALLVMDRYRKEVIQVSTWKNDINVHYLYDKLTYDLPFNRKPKLILRSALWRARYFHNLWHFWPKMPDQRVLLIETNFVIYPLCFLTAYTMTSLPSIFAWASDSKNPDPYYFCLVHWNFKFQILLGVFVPLFVSN